MAEIGGSAEVGLQVETNIDQTGLAVLTLAGELDLASAPKLEEAIEAIAARRPEGLTLDLTDLRFMDSAGIALLVLATKTVGGVTLRRPSPIVRRVIEVTGLSEVLPIEQP
jgi:anti-sigma B factor antagonist